jgi:cyanoexosortase B-associated protein
VVALLALFVAVSALPQYVSGWPWSIPPTVPNQSALTGLRDQGIDLPGWQSDEQVTTKIGGDSWSIQQLSAKADAALDSVTVSAQAAVAKDAPPIFVLLRPQVWHADQPEVEWLDIRGSQRWQTDEHQTLSFTVPAQKNDPNKTEQIVRIKGDFFRAWSKAQTYAVSQWYAWPTGGSASPARWFWVDQLAQWRHHQRMPWVAVNIWIPIEPLSDILPQKDLAVLLGKTLQETLLQTVFGVADSD